MTKAAKAMPTTVGVSRTYMVAMREEVMHHVNNIHGTKKLSPAKMFQECAKLTKHPEHHNDLSAFPCGLFSLLLNSCLIEKSTLAFFFSVLKGVF